MKICTIRELLDAQVLVGEENLGRHVYSACGSDMMSDVLAYVKDQAVLMTGLVNAQVVRTAEMMDMVCIVFVRSKQPTEEMLRLAEESGIVVMSTKKRMYEACGILYSNGLVGNKVRESAV
jgi:predicted transcriptional regulator